MDHEAHQFIADACIESVPVLAPHRQALRAAIVCPDQAPGDHRDHGSRRVLRTKVGLAGRARHALLSGRTDAAVQDLGVLLHYLAEAAAGLPAKHPQHDEYEAQVSAALPHVCARVRPPGELGSRRHLARMLDVAPRLGREGDFPPPDEAAERALDTCVRVAHAVFAPVYHPQALTRMESMQRWRRSNDGQLIGLMRLEHAPVLVPLRNVFGVLWAFLAWISLTLRHGTWYRPAWRFNLPDLAYLGFYACCVVWLLTLLRLGPHTGETVFWQTLGASVITYGLWGIIISSYTVGRDIRGFWTSCFALMGPLSPLMLMFVALSMRFVEIEKPANRKGSSRHKAA